MKIKCQGCVGLSLGYCPGNYCKKFSKIKIKNLVDSNLYIEKIKEENLEKKSKEFYFIY